ncbi:hypothetical protein, partial [Acidithiobacillus ferriphilus]
MATENSMRHQAHGDGRSVDWSALGHATIGTPANRRSGFGRAELSEEVAAYSVSLESIFGQLRRLLIQVGGLLVLQGGSTRTHLEMGAFWESTAEALKTLDDEIAAIKVPRGFAGHHDRITAAVKNLKHIHKEAFTARTAR